MKILWLSWKDRSHPGAGGAEVISNQLRQRMRAEGHEVTLLTCGYPGAPKREQVDGVDVIRIGANRYLHPFQASLYYLRHLRNSFDIVVEEVNAAPYFSVLFGKKSQRFLFYHHLEREVWLHEAAPPINYAGYYVLEPLATRVLSLAKVPLITISESTKQEMARYGFPVGNTHIISEGIELEPLPSLESIGKYKRPTILSLGGVRAMKRTLDQVKAFELAKPALPELRLELAGDISGPYAQKVLDYIKNSPYARDITVHGRVSPEQRLELMRRCHLITVTSVKEGWGLIVTEANSQGTPAVVYDVPGLRDSVRHQKTGLIAEAEPAGIATEIISALQNKTLYDHLRKNAWEWSKQITFAQSYKDFKAATGLT